MTTEQKIIKTKVGVLELAKELGNVSQACKVMGVQPRQFLSPQGVVRHGRRRSSATHHVHSVLTY